MKKLILITLLAISPSIHAGTGYSQCPNGSGDITVTLDNQTISPSEKVHGNFKMRLNDLAYPMVGLATPEADWCFDGDCKVDRWQSIPVVPQGFQWAANVASSSTHPLSKGNHKISFRIYIPEYNCSATATAQLQVN